MQHCLLSISAQAGRLESLAIELHDIPFFAVLYRIPNWFTLTTDGHIRCSAAGYDYAERAGAMA